jgi:hypothetical protein
MTIITNRQLVFAGMGVGMAVLPASDQACAACFGKSDDAMARGMNMGILALLIVITLVLAGLASFFIFLARRAARVGVLPGPSASVPSTTELSSPLSQTTP